MNSTVKKYALIVFVTLLVWVWAYNAMEETLDNVTALITTPQASESDILVTFDKPLPLSLKIGVKGSSKKLTDLQTLMAAGKENLNFIYTPQGDLKENSEIIPLDTVTWLNQSVKMKGLGLAVETAEPEMVQVTVEKLEKKELSIECFDENGIQVTPDSLNPSKVEIFVKPDWVGPARINLSAVEVEKAQKDYVTIKPYVQLAPNDRRYGALVKVMLASTELDTISFQLPKIAFAFSENLQGKYKIKLMNGDVLTGVTTFKGSAEAIEAYKNSPVHITVQALDGDEKKEGEISTDVTYNFPPEYFAKGEIMLAKPPEKARFILIPLTLPATVTE